MTLFEFLMVIAGVVIAIAMAEIVSGWGRMVRAGVNVKFDWLHLGWSLTVLLNAMLYWVGVWAYAELEFQYVAQTWFLVLPTLFLVLVAFALTPDISQISGQSLRDYFISNRRGFFSSYVLFLLFSPLADLVISGSIPYSGIQGPAMLAFLVGGGVCLAITKNLWAHRIGLVLYLLLMLAGGLLPLREISVMLGTGG